MGAERVENESLIRAVAAEFGLAVRRIHVFKDITVGNSSWLLTATDETQVVLRRYHPWSAQAELAYEYSVLRWLTEQGWPVPTPYGEVLFTAGRWWGLNRLVPGIPVLNETPPQRHRRGIDLARLEVAMRPLAEMGQRPGWQLQHTAFTVHTDLDFSQLISTFAQTQPRLADWIATSADATHDTLTRAGATELPITPIHGDFTEWNVHYDNDGLAGVIDFGLCRLESRPYELAIARTWRAPEVIAGYTQELARHGWPLTELEQSLLVPIYHAFRVDMALWAVHEGRHSGDYNLTHIERQLERTAVPCP